MKKLLLIITILMIIILIFIILISNNSITINNNQYTKTIKAKVVDVIEKRYTTGIKFPRTTYYYFLKVEYVVNDETIKTTCEGSLSAYSKSKIGEEIEVLYNPNNKNKCKLINAIN